MSIPKLSSLFEEYLLEKQYITGLAIWSLRSAKTTFKAYLKLVGSEDLPTDESLNKFIIECRKAGNQPKTINNLITYLNLFSSRAKTKG